MTGQTWIRESPLPRPPGLAHRGVHVWCASLDAPPLARERLPGVLTAQERSTATRYVFERDRSRSVASRGLLRWLLGAYLGIQPEDVRLSLGPHGKPELAELCESGELRFNVAHSEGIAIYALTCGRDIGVDVEHVRPMPDAADIAARFFAASEIATLLALSPQARDESFFVCWTRKEAYLKACGVGLALPLDDFEVRLDRGPGSDRLRVPADPDHGAIWALHELAPLPGFLGAVAVPDRNLHLRCRRWA